MVGVEAVPVTVEVDFLPRLPRMVITGLATGQVQETSERVRCAIEASGFEFPRQRIVVNLQPGDLRKTGTRFDLAIAVAILIASGQLPATNDAYVGELGPDGSVRPVRGALAAAITNTQNTLGSLVTSPSAQTAAMGGNVLGLSWLVDLRTQLVPVNYPEEPSYPSTVDMSELQGNLSVVEGILDAIRANVPLLFVGPPGCGKSRIARRIADILPSMTPSERLDIARIHEATGLLRNTSVNSRPFRAPHHTVSLAGLLGDASGNHAGEATLANHGVLFLDEAAQFPRLQMQLLADAYAKKSYRQSAFTLPTNFRWILAVNDDTEAKRVLAFLPKNTHIVHLESVPESVLVDNTEHWPSTADLRACVEVPFGA
jgi:magnesium chelatase family protein